MYRRATATSRRDGEGGFTLVEMIVTIAIAAIIFVALAGALGGALRSLAVQKARTQGNEVATLGIESLQNLSYDALGICDPAAGAPAGLDDRAQPAGTCAAATLDPAWEESNPGWGEHPCRSGAATSGLGFVRSGYSCVRNNISYNVRRYVAWGNEGQTDKRLAVFVSWTDTVGPHEVSQQSSLRAPGAQDIAGLAPPRFTSISVAGVPAPGTSTIALNAAGSPPSAVPVAATMSGLAAGASGTTLDKVYVTFTALDATNEQSLESVFLTSGNGTNWSGSIPTSFRFGNGTQYFVFSTIRKEDGKGNAVISPKVTLGTPPATAPVLSTYTASSSSGGATVQITAAGGLVPDRIDLTASTLNSSPFDTVQVVFESRTGAVTARLRSTGCAGSTCNWVGEVLREAGYSFTTGTKKFYFTVSQPFTGPGTGSTAAEARDVVFTL